MEPKKNKVGVLIVIMLLLIISLSMVGLGTYYKYFNNTSNKVSNTPVSSTETITENTSSALICTKTIGSAEENVDVLQIESTLNFNNNVLEIVNISETRTYLIDNELFQAQAKICQENTPSNIPGITNQCQVNNLSIINNTSTNFNEYNGVAGDNSYIPETTKNIDINEAKNIYTSHDYTCNLAS